LSIQIPLDFRQLVSGYGLMLWSALENPDY